jgi:hypothetical protein
VAATYRWGGGGYGQVIGFDDAYLAAYDGITSHLFNADQVPTRGDLYRAGSRAIRGVMVSVYRDNGRPALGTGARFRAYWTGDRQSHPDHAPKVDDDLALWQVFEGLDPEDRETLVQVAHHLDGNKVREATGWNEREYTARLRKARQNFYRLWFEGETAPELPKRVVVTIPHRSVFKSTGYVYPKQNKSGVVYRARMRHGGRLRELGTHSSEDNAWAAIERARANAVLEEFEESHRQEQPAAQQGVRADVGNSPVPRVA